MSVSPAPVYAAPFDALAERYDQTFSFSMIGLAQRAAVWKKLEKAFRPGERVLEIGCGTGVDACFLADRGVSVLACDSSPQMIAATSCRVTQENKVDLVQPRLLAAEDIASLPSGSFDGAFSNFGALNCVEDVERLAHDLGTLLKPGGTALLCWLGPSCLWEIVWYLTHGNPGKAFRRWHCEGVTAQLAAGATIKVRYPPVRVLLSTFASGFEVQSIHGIGVAVPPSYVERLAIRFPRLLGVSAKADSLLGRCPVIRACGDHILLEFRRKATA